MSGRVRASIQALLSLVAVAAVAAAVWWALPGDRPEATTASLAPTAEPHDAADADGPGPTAPAGTSSQVEGNEPSPAAPPSPTATPDPTPTPLPEPRPFADLVGLGARPDLADALVSPLPDCELTGGEVAPGGTIALSCIREWAGAVVTSSGSGRIVHVNTKPAVRAVSIATAEAGAASTGWSWASQAALGPHVVVDHGPVGDARSVQVVYAGLDTIAPTVRVGASVAAGDAIGTVGSDVTVNVGLWVDNVRHDGAAVVGPAPMLETQREAAATIGETIMTPTDPRCPLSLGGGQLPGASRQYRNGVHQGIDFGCGTSDRYGQAIADGTVVYLVDDYVDPTVADREALLANAAIAGFTPHWTLVMLYGNVVVIDHGIVGDAGRVVTIAAHLESVDPAIELGATVSAGQRLGELGNRGTNASAEGRRGSQDPSLHLHWELFVDDWYLGAGQAPGAVAELVTSALCGTAATPGCPGSPLGG